MSDTDRIPELLTKLEEAVRVMDEAKETDTQRWQTAKAEVDALAAQVQTLTEEKEKNERDAETAKAQAELKELLAGARSSKADLLGQKSGGYKPSDETQHFLRYVWQSKSHDYDEQKAAKAGLADIGAIYMTPEEAGSKATLGTSDATGGYIVPNNVVNSLLKPNVQPNIYRGICTVINDVRGSGVDQPIRNAAPSRMVVAPWGDVKENTNLVYDNYTATLYTIARIYDVANQFLRQSEGAAQQDVIQELTNAAALGESYYILNGTGTSQPYGLLTALTTTGTYVTSHTAAQTTVAGNFATAIAKASGDLAGRNRTPTAVVMNASNYWVALASGADAAGFYISPSMGAPGIDATAQLRVWGIPVFPDVNMPSDSLVAGEWTALKLFFGHGLRIDSSSEAGERWDRNLTGFRGEEEFGLDARPAVYTGAFQRVTDVVA